METTHEQLDSQSPEGVESVDAGSASLGEIDGGDIGGTTGAGRTCKNSDIYWRNEETTDAVQHLQEKEEGIDVRVCAKTAGVLLESDLSKTAKQQGLYLLSLLPTNGKSRSLSYRILKHLMPLGEKVNKILIPKYVQRADSYEVGKTCKKWSYKKKPTELSTHTLTNKNLLKKLANWKEDREQRFAGMTDNDAGTEWLISSIDRLTGSYVSDELMEREGLTWNREKPVTVTEDTGRIWHPFTQLPSSVRLNHLLDAEEVADIDMSKSQIAILSKHWMKDESERLKLQEQIVAKTVYSQLDFYMEKDREKIDAYNLKYHDNQIETTKSLMSKILMGAPDSSWESAQFIREEYPVMMRSIAGYKCKVAMDHDMKVAMSLFARKLQKEEATILSLVADRCSLHDIPVVPIFDGVLTPVSQSEFVRDIFKDVLIKRLDFAPEPTIETAGGMLVA